MPKKSRRPSRYDMLAWTRHGQLVIWALNNVTREEAIEVSEKDRRWYFACYPRQSARASPFWLFEGAVVCKNRIPFRVSGMGLSLTGEEEKKSGPRRRRPKA